MNMNSSKYVGSVNGSSHLITNTSSMLFGLGSVASFEPCKNVENDMQHKITANITNNDEQAKLVLNLNTKFYLATVVIRTRQLRREKGNDSEKLTSLRQSVDST